jgi:transposase
MLFVGDDWAEDHHDVYLMNDTGDKRASRRLPEGLAGIGRLHVLIAEHAEDPAQVVIGIETDRGLWVDALTAAGYQVFAVNPLAAARYRDRHHVSGAKSDPSDAKLLADLVRTDRHNHRPIAGDTAAVEAVKVLARAHQVRETPLTVVNSMTKPSGMTGITNPLGLPPSSTMAHGHAAIEINRSASL